MANIVVLGAGIGGVPAAYELRAKLGKEHVITVINASETFQFVPSNPWIALGWRKRPETTLQIRPYLEKKGIKFIGKAATAIDPATNTVTVESGEVIQYDYLIIGTGPRLAFELIEGTGPSANTQSICTIDHAEQTYNKYEEFLKDPGHIVVGALPGASCYGPAYEYAMGLDTDLRRRKMRDKVPMTYITAEPYIGHLGLGGVGDSKGLLESELRERHIKWITNAKTVKVEPGKMYVEQYNDQGVKIQDHVIDFKFSMMLPPFRGVPAVANVPELCNPGGFVIVDKNQRSPVYKNIYALGVGIAIPPVEQTPVPTGTPKTGYMIESMGTAIVQNIADAIAGKEINSTATWNTICLADMGDTGAAFVALPQIPPRNVTWSKKGKWVHLAKVAFEKYFLYKMKAGHSEPIYERYILKLVGIIRIKG